MVEKTNLGIGAIQTKSTLKPNQQRIKHCINVRLTRRLNFELDLLIITRLEKTPLSTYSLSLATKMDARTALRRCKQLQKLGKLECIRDRQTRFWRIKNNNL
jgi:hypothetical protein